MLIEYYASLWTILSIKLTFHPQVGERDETLRVVNKASSPTFSGVGSTLLLSLKPPKLQPSLKSSPGITPVGPARV